MRYCHLNTSLFIVYLNHIFHHRHHLFIFIFYYYYFIFYYFIFYIFIFLSSGFGSYFKIVISFFSLARSPSSLSHSRTDVVVPGLDTHSPGTPGQRVPAVACLQQVFKYLCALLETRGNNTSTSRQEYVSAYVSTEKQT